MLAHLAFAVAAQGDVKIVPEPGGKRDVPSAPKVCDGGGDVGDAEVDRQVESHQGSQADGDIRIAAKVAIDLQSIAIDGK